MRRWHARWMRCFGVVIFTLALFAGPDTAQNYAWGVLGAALWVTGVVVG